MGVEQSTWLDAQRAAFKKFDTLSKVTQGPGPSGTLVPPGGYVRTMLGEPIILAHKNKLAFEQDIQTALGELNAMLGSAGFSPVTLED